MKLFHFYRNEDYSGVSGTGPVVEGVQFTNGWCALRWISSTSSICFYQSLEEVKAVHSHGGRTEIIVHDFEPVKRKESPAYGAQMELLIRIIEETSHLINLGEDASVPIRVLQAAAEDIKRSVDLLAERLGQQGNRAA